MFDIHQQTNTRTCQPDLNRITETVNTEKTTTNKNPLTKLKRKVILIETPPTKTQPNKH